MLFYVMIVGHDESLGDDPHLDQINLHFFIQCETYNSHLHTTFLLLCVSLWIHRTHSSSGSSFIRTHLYL